jgi:hypothetical protein
VAIAAAVVLALSGQGMVKGSWVGVGLAGLGFVLFGRDRGERPAELAGALLCLGAIAGFIGTTPALSEIVQLLPGLIGLLVLAGALVPIHGQRSRALVKAGAAGLFTSVVLAGLFRAVGLWLLLAAGVGVIVAWDASEHAIGVGEQLGEVASSWRCELPHVAATVGVGIVGVVATVAMHRFGSDDLSLSAFLMLCLAMLLLTAAIRS